MHSRSALRIEKDAGVQKHNSGLAMLWHPYFGTRMVFCLSTILRKIKPLTATIIWHYWIDWALKSIKNGFKYKRKKCCSIKIMLDRKLIKWCVVSLWKIEHIITIINMVVMIIRFYQCKYKIYENKVSVSIIEVQSPMI